MSALKVLHVEDDSLDAFLTRDALDVACLRADITQVVSREELEQAIAQGPPDVILTDNRLPGLDAFQVVAIARARVPNVPVMVLSGGMEDDRIEAVLRAGASRYINKDRLSDLVDALRGLRSGERGTLTDAPGA